jgi:stage V sporulation protein AF
MVLAGAVVLIVDGQDEGIIGGLILSDLAVKVGLFVPETVLYRTLAGIVPLQPPA